ncbi:MAG: NAD(P)/FAD-dependent oxidoreductase, partial [Candidatus Aminicenantes bacterium]|nr:NAD(P)/FAD-dependent oxidoreductase [Candidatus Aminicenantes bacterium]
ELKMDGLFVSIGTLPNTGLVQNIVELDRWGAIKVNGEMRTSREGLYSAGDVSNACPKQVATAVGSGVHAAISIVEYLQSLGI